MKAVPPARLSPANRGAQGGTRLARSQLTTMPPKPPVIVTVVGSKHNFEALHPRYNKTFNESGNTCLDNIIKYRLLPLYPQ